jgi:hypothetical protein
VLRRLGLPGKHIAKQTGVSAAPVSRVLKRAGLSRRIVNWRSSETFN